MKRGEAEEAKGNYKETLTKAEGREKRKSYQQGKQLWQLK